MITCGCFCYRYIESCDWDNCSWKIVAFYKTTTVVQNKRSFSLNDCEETVMRRKGRLHRSANSELNVVTSVGLICAYNTNHSSRSMSLQHSNIRKLHNWIVDENRHSHSSPRRCRMSDAY